MRVTSKLWITALLRRAYSAGAFAAIVKKGAEEAGAIYIVTNDLDGGFALHGPALQASYDDQNFDRLFETVFEPGPEEQVRRRLERECDFDPDLWIVEIEDRLGRSFIDSV